MMLGCHFTGKEFSVSFQVWKNASTLFVPHIIARTKYKPGKISILFSSTRCVSSIDHIKIQRLRSFMNYFFARPFSKDMYEKKTKKNRVETRRVVYIS